ncbi:MAG TPA: isoprenylcysteine carboxylmethyltransferase family protein [Cyclobacteriaceae bacterium]|nr:isoprenylcysteine carboxylmethyltransferase family protein [Cyclobacteriaceae bacterium]
MENQGKSPSLFKHLRDILILPFTVTVIVPYWIYTGEQGFIPGNWLVKGLGIVMMALGLLLFSLTVRLFASKGRGTLAPWSPTQRLVVSGPYRYCRNPMISGVLFILIGESLLLHSDHILIWAGIFLFINTVYFIFYEEPGLVKRFGEEYVAYKKEVPRWIPRFTRYKGRNTVG